MLKKFMFRFMIFLTIIRFGALAFSLAAAPSRLPVPVYISTAIIAWTGIIMMCKKIVKSFISRKELMLYYLLSAISIVFNLIIMKLFSRIDVLFMDLLIIGTLMDIIVDFTLIYQMFKSHRYKKVR